MTNREFYQAIINGDELTEEMKAHATAQLEKLDARNASRSSKPTKAQQENAPIKENILQFLQDAEEGATSAEIGEALGITTNKAAALCRQLREAGTLTDETVKGPKGGKVKKFRIA